MRLDSEGISGRAIGVTGGRGTLICSLGFDTEKKNTEESVMKMTQEGVALKSCMIEPLMINIMISRKDLAVTIARRGQRRHVWGLNAGRRSMQKSVKTRKRCVKM